MNKKVHRCKVFSLKKEKYSIFLKQIITIKEQNYLLVKHNYLNKIERRRQSLLNLALNHFYFK